MSETKENKRGGYREGSGRKATGREYRLTVRVTKVAYDKISKVANRSETIDKLIRRHLR